MIIVYDNSARWTDNRGREEVEEENIDEVFMSAFSSQCKFLSF